MSELFSPTQRYELWLRIELVVTEAWAEIGEIPKSAIERLRHATVDAEHIARLEERLGPDVVAFLDSLAESVGDDARYLRRGLTSSDILDTALALQLVRAADILLNDVDRLSSVVRRRAIEERGTLMAGRTHGIHAEPVSFGFVLAGWLDELDRDRQRLVTTRDDIRVGKLSGAVGTHATVDPRVEEASLAKLSLKAAPVTTQVIARDRHAAYLSTLAVLGEILEGLTIDRERMRANLYRSGGVVFSQRVLLALVQKGMSRQDAYRVVQRAALSALDDGQDFKAIVGQAPEVRERLTAEELAELFDPAYYLRHLDVTFERVGLEPMASSPSPAGGRGQGGGS